MFVCCFAGVWLFGFLFWVVVVDVGELLYAFLGGCAFSLFGMGGCFLVYHLLSMFPY